MTTTLPAGWKPIESAPKTGRTLLLGYWNSHGKWRTVRGQWMSAEYIGQEWDEPDGVEAGWFETAVEADDVPNCWPVTPSHWQPMPAPPCLTCNDQGAVGNILTAEPCPDCSPASVAPGDAQDEQAAFEDWLERTCPSGDVEAVQRQWEASSDYADFYGLVPAPAAGDALPTIKGAAITGGYVVVTPAGWGEDKAQKVRDAILRLFPVNPAYTPKPEDAQVQQQGEA